MYIIMKTDIAHHHTKDFIWLTVLKKFSVCGFLLYSFPKICIQHIFLKYWIFFCYLRVETMFIQKYENNPRFLLWNACQVSVEGYKKYTGNLQCKWHESTPDDNVKKLCQVSGELPNGKQMSTIPIINLRNKFVPVSSWGYKQKLCQ